MALNLVNSLLLHHIWCNIHLRPGHAAESRNLANARNSTDTLEPTPRYPAQPDWQGLPTVPADSRTTQPRPLCWRRCLPDQVVSPYWRGKDRQVFFGRDTRWPVARRKGERGGCFMAGSRRATEGLNGMHVPFTEHGHLLSGLKYRSWPNSWKTLEFD